MTDNKLPISPISPASQLPSSPADLLPSSSANTLPSSSANTLPSSSAPQLPSYSIHPSSYVDNGAIIGTGTKIWHFSHIMSGAVIGEKCSLGQNVNVAGGVTIGNNVKVQNNVSIYAGTEIEDDVFLGPSCVLTNVSNPRSQVNRHALYEKTVIRRGASLGANCTIVCGVTIGRYALIGAGAVVTKDVPDYALMVGNPARQKGWVSRHGHVLWPEAASSSSLVVDSSSPEQTSQTTASSPAPKLPSSPLICPESGLRYQLSLLSSPAPQLPTNYQLTCLDLDEEAPLPAEMTTGIKSYDEFKQ